MSIKGFYDDYDNDDVWMDFVASNKIHILKNPRNQNKKQDISYLYTFKNKYFSVRNYLGLGKLCTSFTLFLFVMCIIYI